MSHFTVLVIGSDVEGQLAPYHEFECTGHNDEYVQHVDILAATRAEYETQTTARIRLADGTLVEPHDDRFLRTPTPAEAQVLANTRPFDRPALNGQPIAAVGRTNALGHMEYRVREFPPDATEVRVPVPSLMSFAEFVEHWNGYKPVLPGEAPDIDDTHKYGYMRLDAAGEVVELVQRTNPNAKWDWWVIGGRWTGFFKLKHNASGAVGMRGLMTTPALPGYADQALNGDIDWASMRKEAADEAAERYAAMQRHTGGQRWLSWPEVRAQHGADDTTAPDFTARLDAARAAYHNQPALLALNTPAARDEVGFLLEYDEFLVDRDTYVRRAAQQARMTYAVVKDGQWYQGGDVGWWGITSNELPEHEWAAQFAQLVDDLPPDTLLTVVDCHI